ncbi:GGDEF domain protein [Burkholderia mallei]|nr:GGDEF domain protein [Burkholderia mallei]
MCVRTHAARARMPPRSDARRPTIAARRDALKDVRKGAARRRARRRRLSDSRGAVRARRRDRAGPAHALRARPRECFNTNFPARRCCSKLNDRARRLPARVHETVSTILSNERRRLYSPQTTHDAQRNDAARDPARRPLAARRPARISHFDPGTALRRPP